MDEQTGEATGAPIAGAEHTPSEPTSGGSSAGAAAPTVDTTSQPGTAITLAGSPPMLPAPPYAPPSAPLYPPYAQGPATWPGPPMVPYAGPPAAPRQSALAIPFPRWVSALLFFGALALLGLIYAADEILLGGDWAEGAQVAGVAALALAGVTLLVTLIRIAAGRRALTTIALGLLMVVVLAASGGSGLIFSAPLHAVQARALEQSGAWAAAIQEYALAGESAPNAPDIARAYDEWGEHLLGAGQYSSAVANFTAVINDYSGSGTAVIRAHTGRYRAYVAWVRSNTDDVPYTGALLEFSTYQKSSACDASCQAEVTAIEAQAHFQYGTQLASQMRYADAVAQFEAVQAQFPQSPYVTRAHAAAATAYYALGQQQIHSDTCPAAVPTYQKLASAYADTPEGKQAKTALAAPQTVSGTLKGFPSNPLPTLHLSKSINPGNYYFSDEYSTTVNASSGTFTFTGVRPGNYNISTSRNLGTEIDYVYYYDKGTGNMYDVHVGPLCAVQVGTLAY